MRLRETCIGHGGPFFQWVHGVRFHYISILPMLILFRALSALRQPKLFSSLVLVDPVIVPYDPKLRRFETKRWAQFARGAIVRKVEWASKREALKAFSSSPFFMSWDSAVLETYVDCGLYEDNISGTVKLKTASLQEAVTYM
jgi:hypothetical protein